MSEQHKKIEFIFLNIGHFFDHFLILIFATVAMAMATDRRVVIADIATPWQMTYAELIPLSVAGFVAFGVCSLPAGWLADKWSRPGMIAVFFLGMGCAAILASFSQSIWHLAAGIFLMGIMGAIYHPVGLAMVVHERTKTGVPLAVNGVFGNLGVASAPLASLVLIDLYSWRAAFALPGLVCVAIGLIYLLFLFTAKGDKQTKAAIAKPTPDFVIDRHLLIRIFAIIFFTAAIGSFIFQSTTFALPKIFDEKLAGIVTSGLEVGIWAFVVLAAASIAQLVVGYLVDNHSIKMVFVAIAGMQAVLFALMINLTGIGALIVSVAFMLMVFGQIPINDVLIGRIAKSEWRARAYAARYIVSFLVMASTVPAIAALHKGWGFHALFLVMAGGASLIFLAVLCLPSSKVLVRGSD